MALQSGSMFPTLAPLLQVLARFFAWWSGELLSFTPMNLRLWWQGANRIVLLSFDGQKMVLERLVAGTWQSILARDVPEGNSLTGLRAEIADCLMQEIGRNYRLLVSVPRNQVLKRALTLPAAVEENLQQTLSFELDRYMPFNSSQAYFDFQITGRDTPKGQLHVELAATQRKTVDEVLSRSAQLGLASEGAVFDDLGLRAGTTYTKFHGAGAAVAPQQSTTPRRWRVGASLVTIVLLAALLATPLWQKHITVTAMRAPLSQAQHAAMETDALRDQLAKLVEQDSLLPKMKKGSHSALRALDDLSKRLPDDTFIMQFDFDGKSILIQGETGSAATLIGILEDSPFFKDVAYKEQLTKIQGTPFDRFLISAVLEAEAPKPPEVKDAAPAPASSGEKTGGNP